MVCNMVRKDKASVNAKKIKTDEKLFGFLYPLTYSLHLYIFH